MKWVVRGIVIVVLVSVLFRGWEVQRFIDPTYEDAKEEIMYFTGYQLSKSDGIIFSKRSRPDAWTADYHSCYILKMNENGLRSLQEVVQKPPPVNYELGCTDHNEFRDIYQNHDFQFYAFGNVTPDEFYYTMIDKPKQTVFIGMVRH